MAINPQIALSVNPIQLPDLAKSYGEGVQLRNAIQQGQMNAERLKAEQRTNQLADLDAQDQLKLRDVYSKAGGDPEKTVQGAIQAGVSPKSVQGLQQHFADYAEKIAKTKSDELATQKYRDDQVLGLHDQAIQLAQTNPQGYAAAWPQLYAAAVKAEPEAAKHLDPNTPPTLDQLQLSRAGYVTHTSFLTAEEEKRKQAAELRAQSEESRKAAMAVPQLAEAGAKAASSLRQEDANVIAQAAKQGGPPAIAAAIRQLPAERRAPFAGLTGKEKPEDILAIGTTPAEQITAGRTAATAAEAARHNRVSETEAQGRLGVERGNLALRTKENEMKYGAGTADFWAHQLQDNPDSVKELPAELRSAVGKKFTESTGLPLPTPLAGQALTAENGARNALDNINFIRKAIQNPEVRAQLGPLMGRLGDVEQHVGTAVGLSPEAEALGQELRTRMRYFQLQEGKALLGGRPNAKLMETLSGASANPKMDAGILEGALKGAEGSAQEILDNNDKQRFGGKMRSREMRGQTPAQTTPSAPKYKAGDTRVINGKTYTRDADGNWK